jgi:uncharacterized protein with FMN-binding domain
MKKYIKIVLIVVLTIIILSGGFLFYLSRGLEAGSQLVINQIDLSSLEDGSYNGRYDGGRWSNEVKVEVKNHEIKDITLEQDIMLSQPEVTEKIFKKVIAEQKVNVDVISGATVTSKAYLKAIEKDLNNK